MVLKGEEAGVRFLPVHSGGLPVVEETGRALGTVQAVTPGVANDVLELDSGVLLPMVEDCIRVVDLEGGRIEVAEGFAG